MAIELDHISKSIDGRKILHNLSVTIAVPGITCFMGPSGVGKTTLLHILMALTTPDSGSIKGLEHMRTAAVFQEDRLLPWCTALENAAIALPREKHAYATKALQQVGLQDDMHKKTDELSGGMQRRVAIARALAVQPSLLILDEPFAGLDEELHLDILRLFRDLGKEIAIVLVSHDPYDAEYLGASTYYLHAAE